MKYVLGAIILIVGLFIYSILTDDRFCDMEIQRLKVCKTHINKQKKLNGFSCSSIGGGGTETHYDLFCLGFSTHEQLNINSARKYLVDGLLLFRDDINSAENLQQYLIEKPFPIEKIEYSIYVNGDNGLRPKFPNGPTSDQRISYVSWYDNEIEYNIDVHKDKLPVTIHTETFDEAVAILNAEKSRSNN